MDNLVIKKPYIIIQARVGSSRLPNKVMTPINGLPMIGYLFNRIKKSEIPIILATSTNVENDKLVEFAEKNEILTYRGSEENVLERFYEAAKFYNASDIIRVTGDNPLVDGNFIKEQSVLFSPTTRKYYLNQGKDKKFPLGLTYEMFSFELLEEAYMNAKTKFENEHVTVYMHQNIPGDIKSYTFKSDINFPNARLTVDTETDLELISKLISEYNCHLKNTVEIIDVLKKNPSLLNINKEIQQKKWND